MEGAGGGGNKESSLSESAPVAFILDHNTLHKIERLVGRYRQEFASSSDNQTGAGEINRKMRLVEDATPKSVVKEDLEERLNDPANVVAIITGEGKGISAIRRFQALYKVYTDHITGKHPLPPKVTSTYIQQQMQQLLQKYGKEMKRNVSQVQQMDREEAVRILRNTLVHGFRQASGEVSQEVIKNRIQSRHNSRQLMDVMVDGQRQSEVGQRLLEKIASRTPPPGYATQDPADVRQRLQFDDGEVSFGPSPRSTFKPVEPYHTPIVLRPELTQFGTGLGNKRVNRPRFKRQWKAISC